MLCQRWTKRRDTYRPAGEVIDPAEYAVEPISEADAKAFVKRHHYSGSYPAARCRVGLLRGSELVGVAVFSVPAQIRALPRWTGQDHETGVELGRFVLLDEVAGNGETWFLRRAMSILREIKPEVRAVLSYSDPLERTTADGEIVKPGHIGTIYQAHNARHLGRGKPRMLVLDAFGRVVSERAISKIRNGERGAEHAERNLIAAGAPARERGEDARAWVARSLAGFRRLRHPGNLVYAWGLDRRATRMLPGSMPFPKAA